MGQWPLAHIHHQCSALLRHTGGNRAPTRDALRRGSILVFRGSRGNRLSSGLEPGCAHDPPAMSISPVHLIVDAIAQRVLPRQRGLADKETSTDSPPGVRHVHFDLTKNRVIILQPTREERKLARKAKRQARKNRKSRFS